MAFFGSAFALVQLLLLLTLLLTAANEAPFREEPRIGEPPKPADPPLLAEIHLAFQQIRGLGSQQRAEAAATRAEIAQLREIVEQLHAEVREQKNEAADCSSKLDALMQAVQGGQSPTSVSQATQISGSINENVRSANRSVAETPVPKLPKALPRRRLYDLDEETAAYVRKFRAFQNPSSCADKKFLVAAWVPGGLGAQIHTTAHWACTAMAHDRIVIQVR